jgi:hypothetical protein
LQLALPLAEKLKNTTNRSWRAVQLLLQYLKPMMEGKSIKWRKLERIMRYMSFLPERRLLPR